MTCDASNMTFRKLDNLVSDLYYNGYSDFDYILKTFDTTKMINISIPPSTAGQLPNVSVAGAESCNLPFPTWEKSGFGGNSAQNQQFEDLYFTVLLDRCLMDIYSTSQYSLCT
jgi:hypothetical protein